MRIGTLRDRVTIQSATKSQDATGAIVNTWAEFATVWASIEPLSGREFFAANQVQSNVSTRIRIRYLANVTAAMRVKNGNDYYDIQAVIHDSNSGREHIQLMCVQRGAEGFRNG